MAHSGFFICKEKNNPQMKRLNETVAADIQKFADRPVSAREFRDSSNAATSKTIGIEASPTSAPRNLPHNNRLVEMGNARSDSNVSESCSPAKSVAPMANANNPG